MHPSHSFHRFCFHASTLNVVKILKLKKKKFTIYKCSYKEIIQKFQIIYKDLPNNNADNDTEPVGRTIHMPWETDGGFLPEGWVTRLVFSSKICFFSYNSRSLESMLITYFDLQALQALTQHAPGGAVGRSMCQVRLWNQSCPLPPWKYWSRNRHTQIQSGRGVFG